MIRATVNPSVYVRGSVLRSLPRRADSPSAFRQVLGARRLRGSISPAAVTAIANAIQTQEGYYPGSVAYRNNNPGNLTYAGQPGATPGVGGFAAFDTLADGQAALQNQITLDATRGTDVNGNPTTTLAQLITSWAPPSENNTAAYIANVSATTGFDPNAPLSSLSVAAGSTMDYSADATDTSDASLVDLSALSTPVDLSSVGLSSSTPVWEIGAGVLGLALLARLLF
jgi:hypothetical protein